jgi:hypothetical protein
MELEEPMELQFNDEGAMEVLVPAMIDEVGGGGNEVGPAWEIGEPMVTAEDAVTISNFSGVGDDVEGEDALEIHIPVGEGDDRVEVGVEETLS